MTQTTENQHARVFFALWQGEAERAAMAAWQTPLHKLYGGRMMAAEKLHNTLVFLGDVECDRLEVLQLAAQEVSAVTFQIVFDIPPDTGGVIIPCMRHRMTLPA